MKLILLEKSKNKNLDSLLYRELNVKRKKRGRCVWEELWNWAEERRGKKRELELRGT